MLVDTVEKKMATDHPLHSMHYDDGDVGCHGDFSGLAGLGYEVGDFPTTLTPGVEAQQFRISDSEAFSNLRGIAKTSHPFDAYPMNDHSNQVASALSDQFTQNDLAGVSSLMPGQYSFNSKTSQLGDNILSEFEAGASTFNSLPNGMHYYSQSESDVLPAYKDSDDMGGVEGLFGGGEQRDDLPLTPFSKQYPNFGAGQPDYGFSDVGTDEMSNEIIRAYSAVLPNGSSLAGAKEDLMPTFSGISALSVEARPIMQSLGKSKNTLYLGGLTELPDELKIDPRMALRAISSIPGDVIQSMGELRAALDEADYNPAAKGSNGARLGQNMMMAAASSEEPDGLYDYPNTESDEPLAFDKEEDAMYLHRAC